MESIEQYKSILETFNSESKIRNVEEQVYDANFGGAYIDDSGELVVLLVETNQDSIENISANAKSGSLKIEDCEYSYNELMWVIDAVNQNLEVLKEKGIIISEMYEDVYNNCVKIKIIGLTAEKEVMVRAIIDSPCMEISNSDVKGEETDSVDAKGGDTIYDVVDKGYSTLGFCARRNGESGFIISGHAGNHINDVFMYNDNTILGYVTASAYYSTSTADAAFVTKGNNVTTTNKIGVYKCQYLGDIISDYPVGAVVYKLGQEPYPVSGKITSNSHTMYWDERFFISQSTASYPSEGGDSGGPVFMVKDVINGQITCKLLGIHKGRAYDKETEETLYTVFSRYNCIKRELDAYAITN